jgi:outer membrane protein assembly factor BamD (BamD/ComL family)
VRYVLVLLVTAWSVNAPLQCQSEPPHDERRYERPPEALYDLAQRFQKQGDERAWRTTLEMIVERYPNSREAVMAKADLAQGFGG